LAPRLVGAIPLKDFFPENRYILWRVDSDTNLSTLYAHHSDSYIGRNLQRFVDPARQSEHGSLLSWYGFNSTPSR
jgi:hypothetical protein